MAVRIESHAEPIPGYRLIERLGGGGFGEVWKAEAPGGLFKAIKFVYGDLSAASIDAQRAEQELKALNRVKTVRHPYILSLERVDIIAGQLLIVMELADRNLWDRFKECRVQGLPGIPREELLAYMEETAEALDLMNHHYQLQHLDIKPQNLFLVHHHVKVADFGLVKDLEGMQASVTGGVTPVYAAPETFDGWVSRFCDQYSLAIVYQELLTGQRPFAGTNVRQLILQHLQATPNVSPLAPGEQPIIARALAKNPDERYPTCADLVRALQGVRIAAVPGQSAQDSSGSRAGATRAQSDGRAQEPQPQHCIRHPSEETPPEADGRPRQAGRPAHGEPHLPQSTPNGEGTPSNGLATTHLNPGGPPHVQRETKGGSNGTAAPAPPPGRGSNPGLPPAAREESVEDGTRTAHIRMRPAPSDQGVVPGKTHPFQGPDGTQTPSGRANVPARDTAPATPGQPRVQAPPEVNGEGVLFPALVIGLGQLGLTVLQRLREQLNVRCGAPASLPQLRLLLVDTDPEVIRSARVGSGHAGLSANEVLLAPLNRPSYYLKPREGRPPLDAWLNPRMVYRIPRSQVTTGVRALGRLAFCDNYRSISRRLREELTACLDPAALTGAARRTGLGLRTNRPRIYLISSLAGGTGSGMFLDMAYTLRALLREAGYAQPDVVGLLLLPAVDRQRTRLLTLGNAYAALTELRHFATPGNCFQARYHERGGLLQDSEPPFSRCLVLPLPEETDEVAGRELVELAGQFLCGELCSPLGRAADLGRAELPGPPWEERGLHYHTFGLFPLSWPRHELVRVVSRRLCQRLVQRWISKDSKAMAQQIQEWVQEQWVQQELGADSFIHRLRVEALRALGKPTESAFAEILEPLAQRIATTTPSKSKRGGEIDVAEAAPFLEQLEQLLGKPGDDASADPAGSLVAVLREAAQKLAGEWGQKLAELPVHLIEEPSFRLAGAEEATRQLVASIEQVLQHQEPLVKDLTTRAEQSYTRLRGPAVPSRPVRLAPAALLEELRGYAKTRFQSLVMQQVTATFVSLRGHLSDELREINFCRVRLTELLRQLEQPAGVSSSFHGDGTPPIGRRVYPSGCKDLREAVEKELDRFTPEVLLELDQCVETMLKERFTALVNVCLTSANVLKNVEQAMLETAGKFLSARLEQGNVAEMFLEQHAHEELAVGEVAGFFDEAAPEVSAGPAALREVRGGELSIVAVPEGPAGERFLQLARRAQPEVEILSAPSADDVVLYREMSNLPLAELEQLGPVGRDAYLQMTATEQFTPHSRTDIDFGE